MLMKSDKTKKIQRKYHILEDGLLGPHTVDCMYRDNAAVVEYPYEARFYGCDVIVGSLEGFIMFSPGGRERCRDYNYSMSGTFTHPYGVTPISIMVSEGKVIRGQSCRYWAGYPETVLYYTYDGEYGVELVKDAGNLPGDIKWAIGGGNLLDFMPREEGFCKFTYNGETFNHGDVYRRTAHVGFIIDALGNILGIYHPNCTMTEFRKKALSMGAIYGVFVDGGGIPAMNTPTIDRNIWRKQGSMVQFKQVLQENTL